MANETADEVQSTDVADEKAAEKGANDVEEKKKKKKKETKVTKKEETEEEESSDDEEQQGILDKPLVIEGKRERKSTEFLVHSTEVKKEVRTLVFEGKGERLGSLDRVNLELGKSSALELKPLHRLLFGRDGRQAEIKKNIRNFNGFTFDKGSKEFQAKQQAVERFTCEGLKRMCEILDLEKKGKREDLMIRVLDYLMSPESSGKPLPAPKKKKSSKKATGKGTKRKSTPAKSKKEVDNDEEDDEEEEEEEGEEEPPKKQKAKPKAKTTTEKKKAPKKKGPVAVKITPLKKGSTKKTPKKEKPVVLDDTSSDEEPLAKKAKKLPTNEQIEKLVKELLDGADLEEVTMKSICKQVFDHYPSFDLTNKKEFIKETVKKVIS